MQMNPRIFGLIIIPQPCANPARAVEEFPSAPPGIVGVIQSARPRDRGRDSKRAPAHEQGSRTAVARAFGLRRLDAALALHAKTVGSPAGVLHALRLAKGKRRQAAALQSLAALRGPVRAGARHFTGRFALPLPNMVILIAADV